MTLPQESIGVQPVETPAEAIRLWRHLHGDRPDLLSLFSAFWKGRDGKGELTNPSSRYFLPSQLNEANAWAARESTNGREVFFGVAQLLVASRRKENAAPSRVVHADMDGAPLDACPIRPTALVESSPGRYHAYWRLNRLMQPDDIEQLNRRMVLATGADKAAVDAVRLLRVPGTQNRKRRDLADVKLLWIDEDRSVDVAELDRMLPPLPKSGSVDCGSRPVASALSDDDEQVIALLVKRNPAFAALWQGDTAAFADEHGHVDDSDVDWAMLRELLRATGLDADRTERLARMSKLGESRNGKWTDQRDGKNYLRYSIDRAIARWSETGAESPPTPPPTPPGGSCPQCPPLKERVQQLEEELSAVRQAEQIIAEVQRNPALNPSVKAVTVSVGREIASQRSRGIRGSYLMPSNSPLDATRPGTGDGLAQRVGLSPDTVTGALKILSGPGGPLTKRLTRTVTESGQYSSQLAIEPPEGETDLDPWQMLRAVASFAPTLSKAREPRLRPIGQRCRAHPLAGTDKTTTLTCPVDKNKIKTTTVRLSPYIADSAVRSPLGLPSVETSPMPQIADSEPDAGIDGSAVAGEPEPFSLNYSPSFQPDRLVSLEPQHVAPEHACHSCGAFADEHWGPVVEVGRVWLHAWQEAPCHMPMAVAS